MNEVLEGLLLWYARQIETILKHQRDKKLRVHIIRNSRHDFLFILNTMNFTESEMSTPLKSSTHEILGLYNPYSKASCILMNLYSLEIGSPPLYSDANQKARNLDKTFLKELGPFLCAFGRVTS